MMPLYLKYLITAALVVLISEVARHSDRLGALIGALPLVTLLAMFWLYMGNQPSEKIGNHAWYTFWYVIPTLPMFALFPFMLDRWGFLASMGCSVLLTVGCFVVLGLLVRPFGIEIW
ncbi:MULTISPECIES: DUF3147 family protein [unclassified Alcanivorax]|uniref:DUF3147 family protein n=1 Tax=unclassified Alcanivorax TaxID=2638842 RepID=UPI000A982C12|nr:MULTISPECIES: DUF3147 family protein [unclassified Alcanivorax]